MFFFFDEREIAQIPEHLHYRYKGIFFIKTGSNVHLTDFIRAKHDSLSEYVFIEPEIFWATDFNIIFEQILMSIGTELFTKVISAFSNLKQRYSELSESTIIRSLLNIHKAKEIEYTQFELKKYARNFLQALKHSDENFHEVFYKLFKGNQKKKAVFLAILFAILYTEKRRKIVIFLRNIDVALQAATHYVRAGIIIRFISILELTTCPTIVIIPCNENIFEEYKEMYNYLLITEFESSRRPRTSRKKIKHEYLYIKEVKARCANCAYLQRINTTHYRCPRNKLLPDPNTLPPYFGEKCRLYKPSKEI
jgi:hypothetical protein